MSKRYFGVEIKGYAIVELDDDVIDAVDDEWRSVFYQLHSAHDVAETIAYNLIINKWNLSSLDGWADQPDENAIVILKPDWLANVFELTIEEVEELNA